MLKTILQKINKNINVKVIDFNKEIGVAETDSKASLREVETVHCSNPKAKTLTLPLDIWQHTLGITEDFCLRDLKRLSEVSKQLNKLIQTTDSFKKLKIFRENHQLSLKEIVTLHTLLFTVQIPSKPAIWEITRHVEINGDTIKAERPVSELDSQLATIDRHFSDIQKTCEDSRGDLSAYFSPNLQVYKVGMIAILPILLFILFASYQGMEIESELGISPLKLCLLTVLSETLMLSGIVCVDIYKNRTIIGSIRENAEESLKNLQYSLARNRL